MNLKTEKFKAVGEDDNNENWPEETSIEICSQRDTDVDIEYKWNNDNNGSSRKRDYH